MFSKIIQNLFLFYACICLYTGLVEGWTPTPCPSPSRRYPVGYNPDNRTRPNYGGDSCPSRNDQMEADHACSPMKLKPKPLRPAWVPPEGYNPAKRKLRMPLTRTDSSVEGEDVGSATETIDFENADYNDNKTRLCTGIWMGRTILQKKCVCLNSSDIPIE